MSREDDAPEAVGYKKPPKHSRFKKGQSGNPSGRRKGRSSTVKDNDEPFLSTKIGATVAGKRVRIARRDAAKERLFSIAMGGNIQAFALLFKLDTANDNKRDEEQWLSDEQLDALIERYLARQHGKGGKGG